MFAIINTRSERWLYGTDFRYHPPHQRTSKNQMLTFEDKETAKFEFKRRQCNKDYRIAVLKTVEIKKLLDEE